MVSFTNYFLAQGRGGLWFLPALFVFSFLVWLEELVFNKIAPPTHVENHIFGNFKIFLINSFFLFLPEIFFLLVYLYIPSSLHDPLMVLPLLLYWPYFVIGFLISKYKIVIYDYAAGFMGLIFFIVWWSNVKYDYHYEIADQISRFCAVLFFYYCFKNLSIEGAYIKKMTLGILKYYGKQTLPIYIMHYFFISGLALFVESHCGGLHLIELLFFCITSIYVATLCVIIKKLATKSKILALLLFGE